MFNEKDHPRDNDGKFTEGSRRSNSEKVIEAIKKYSSDLNKDLINTDVPRRKEKSKTQEELDALLGEEFKGFKGQAAIDKLLKERRGHVKGAFRRDDIGDIDLFWGNDTAGLQHIIMQREKEKPGHAKEILSQLNAAITEGRFDKRNQNGNFELEYIHDGVEYRIIIAPDYHGNKITYVLTAFRRGKKTKH